jgi:heme oxygenase (mycobilin-producing)
MKGGIAMLSKIIIKRRFKKGSASDVMTLLHDLRYAAMSQPGYITGETLMQHDDPQKMVVIGSWQSMESWHEWKNSAKRKEFELKLANFQEEPTTYEEYVVSLSMA